MPDPRPGETRRGQTKRRQSAVHGRRADAFVCPCGIRGSWPPMPRIQLSIVVAVEVAHPDVLEALAAMRGRLEDHRARLRIELVSRKAPPGLCHLLGLNASRIRFLRPASGRRGHRGRRVEHVQNDRAAHPARGTGRAQERPVPLVNPADQHGCRLACVALVAVLWHTIPLRRRADTPAVAHPCPASAGPLRSPGHAVVLA